MGFGVVKNVTQDWQKVLFDGLVLCINFVSEVNSYDKQRTLTGIEEALVR